MNKIKRILLVLLSIALFFSAGCKKQNSIEDTTIQKEYVGQEKASVYYLNAEGNNLVKKDINIENLEKEEAFNLLINKVIENPNEEDIKSAVRTGTKCLSINEKGKVVLVNLSKEFYNEQNISDILSVGAIVKTLCSIDGVDGVSILIENNPLTNAEGEEMGVLRDTDFVFDADSLESDEEYVTLYFSDENGENLVSEIRTIKVPKGEVMEKLVVSELIEGPKNEKNVPVIPSGTKILSVETKEGVCFVNLSKEVITKHPGGSSAETMTIYSIVNSLTELANISKVQILIDGEIREVFNHVLINEPLDRDTTYIIK